MKWFAAGLTGIAIAAALSCGARADEILYHLMYFMDGKVMPPTSEASVSTDNRMVVLYKTDLENGYAMDLTGSAGNSGRSGEYMINSMDDWRMEVEPGTYWLAVVKGLDDYGANPRPVTISGDGFETAAPIYLAKGEGLDSPSLRALPGWLAYELPVFKSVCFDQRLYQKILVEGPRKMSFVIDPQPKISVVMTAGNIGIDKNKLSVVLDENAAGQKTYSLSQFSDYNEIMGPAAPREIDYSVDLKSLGDVLPVGDHVFTFYAGNAIGSTYETANVSVMSGQVEVLGTPISYPSPVFLSSQNSVMLQYGLSKDANIDIYLFDITATVVKKFSFNAGQNGGKAAGTANPNKVTWDLMTDQGTRVAVGTYLWEIVDRDNKRIIGKGKLPAAP